MRVRSCLFTALLVTLICVGARAQAPNGISYQAVLRDADGKALANQAATLRLSLTSSDGTTVYFSETHSVQTDALGMMKVVLGGGQVETGSFAGVPWSSGGPIYLKVEVKLDGQTAYTPMGSEQLQSVPYALHAANGQPMEWLGSLATPPENPTLNQAYYNSVDKKSYVWDGDSWEVLAQDGLPGPQGPVGPAGVSIQWLGTLASPPASPTLNQAYYNSVDKKSYVWDGDSWEVLAQDGVQGPAGPLVEGTTGQTLRHDGSTWTASSLLTNTGAGVGVNTSTPTRLLDVNGDQRLRGHLYDNANTAGDSGQFLGKGEGGVLWQNLPEGLKGSGADGTMAIWKGEDSLASLPNMTFNTSLSVVGNATANPDDPIFEVKNSNGDIIFGVYQEGVRINIKDDPIGKGVKGGFAVGGLTNQTKAGPVEYLRITPDSARIYVKQETGTKGLKGGFAVGGLTNQVKGVVSQNLLFLAPDSARIYVKEDGTKGVKGGFAVGGLTNQTKSPASQFLNLTPENYLIGYEAGKSITTGLYNSFMGYQAGMSTAAGSWNTFLGYQSGMTNTGNDNTFIGYMAGKIHQTKGGNVYIGSKAGANASNGEQNVLIGESAGYSVLTGFKNVFIGFETGYSTTNGYNNVFLGTKTGYANTTGSSNVYIGDSTAVNSISGNKNVFLGNYSGLNNTGGSNNVYIGFEAGYLGQSASQNICIGNYSGYSNTSSQNLFVGEYAGEKNTSGNRNSFVGFFAGQLNVTGNYNSYFGQFAGMDNTKSYNTFIGYWSGGKNVDGENNTFLGYRSGQGSNGSNNVFLGYKAGEGNTGSNNVLIGNNAGDYTGNKSNVLYIANSSSDPPLIFGDFSTGNVGLGTVTPDKKLHVEGDARVTGSIYYGTGATIYNKPDFVFNSEYADYFTPTEVDRYINRHGHLPWLTPASKENDGVNLTRMQFETVETVENLQLQIIEQQRKIDEQQDEIEQLKAELKAIKKMLQNK